MRNWKFHLIGCAAICLISVFAYSEVPTVTPSYFVEAEKQVIIFDNYASGNALDFDGQNDYIRAGSIPALSVEDDFTWSFWVKLESGNDWSDVVLGNRIGPEDSKFIKFTPLRFVYQNHEHDGTIEYSIPTEVWINLAVVKDGPVLTYYSNGDSVGTGIVTKNMSSNPLFFGGDPETPYGSIEHAACVLDEIQIWNIARSEGEIRDNMYYRLSGDEEGLVGYWSLDEGEGQIVSDLSGNGNNGQLGSGPDVDSSDPSWISSDAPVMWPNFLNISSLEDFESSGNFGGPFSPSSKQ